MFQAKEETSVDLGGVRFSFSARKSYLPCQFVCGGFTGLHPSGKWSTWSPGRYPIPSDIEKMAEVFGKAVGNYSKWPARTDSPDTYVNMALSDSNLHLTCGNCQIVCWGNRDETRENLRLLRNSGCVVQYENGDVAALPPEEADRAVEEMSDSHRRLYTG